MYETSTIYFKLCSLWLSRKKENSSQLKNSMANLFSLGRRHHLPIVQRSHPEAEYPSDDVTSVYTDQGDSRLILFDHRGLQVSSNLCFCR